MGDKLCISKIYLYFCRVRIKKVLISGVIAVYFVFACGIVLNVHFCMGRFASVDLYKKPPRNCSICGMEVKNPDCCHDEVRIVKLANAHQHSNLAFHSEAMPFLSCLPFFYFTIAPINGNISINKITHPPPLISQQDSYLQNGVFRI